MRDITTRVTKKRTGPGAYASIAFIGDSTWVTRTEIVLGVPNFGTLTFTHCSVNGKALAHWHPGRYRRMVLDTVQIATGKLTSQGTAFATHFKHS